MGKFTKGESGNPAGRPRGRTPAGKLRRELERGGPAAVRKVIELARGGDLTAIKLVLDRVCPVLRPVDLPAPAVPAQDGLNAQAQAVVESAMAGIVTPDQAKDLAAVLAQVARIQFITDMEERLVKLEDRIEGANRQA